MVQVCVAGSPGLNVVGSIYREVPITPSVKLESVDREEKADHYQC